MKSSLCSMFKCIIKLKIVQPLNFEELLIEDWSILKATEKCWITCVRPRHFNFDTFKKGFELWNVLSGRRQKTEWPFKLLNRKIR